MAYCCFRCGKEIKGKKVITSIPRWIIELKLDFNKAYHPSCYKKEQIKAGKELFPDPE
jgi:hypothetical protein